MKDKFKTLIAISAIALVAINAIGMNQIVREQRRQTDLATAQVEIAELQADLEAYKTIMERNPDSKSKYMSEYDIAKQAQNVILELHVIHESLEIKQRDGFWGETGNVKELKYDEDGYNPYKGLEHGWSEQQIVKWLEPK